MSCIWLKPYPIKASSFGSAWLHKPAPWRRFALVHGCSPSTFADYCQSWVRQLKNSRLPHPAWPPRHRPSRGISNVTPGLTCQHLLLSLHSTRAPFPRQQTSNERLPSNNTRLQFAWQPVNEQPQSLVAFRSATLPRATRPQD